MEIIDILQMERQRATTQVAHNDEFSKALIASASRYLGEEQIPSLQKKGGEDDFSKKDPKAKASPADPAVVLATGSGVKQSHGAEIKYTNVVKKEEVESDETTIEEAKNKEGKEQGIDGKACWKGYKYAGTENGKDKCVKENKDEKEGADKKAENKFHTKLDKLVHKTFGKSSDEKKMKEEVSLQDIVEKAVSKSQQRFMGMVHAKKKGELKDGSEKVDKAAASLTGKEAEKFASTKHKGLPEKKAQKEEFELTEKKLDPVGKEDSDVNNDGKVDKQDSYLKNRRSKVAKVMAAKKRVQEMIELQQEMINEKKQ
jgi:hypothetical protein